MRLTVFILCSGTRIFLFGLLAVQTRQLDADDQDIDDDEYSDGEDECYSETACVCVDDCVRVSVRGCVDGNGRGSGGDMRCERVFVEQWVVECNTNDHRKARFGQLKIGYSGQKGCGGGTLRTLTLVFGIKVDDGSDRFAHRKNNLKQVSLLPPNHTEQGSGMHTSALL